MKYASVVMLCTLGIGGCLVGPNYHVPNVSSQPGWSSTQPASDTTDTHDARAAPTSRPTILESGGDLPDKWWRTLGDPALNRLVEQAIVSNLTLREAEARIREARAQSAGARAGLFPTVRGDGGYSFNHDDGPLFPVEAGDYQFGAVGFDTAWELDLFGGTRRSVEASVDTTEAQIEAKHDGVVSVLAEVCRVYVGLRTDQARTAIARDNLHIARQSLELAKRRRAAGIAGDLDVVRAQALVTATAATLPQLQSRCLQEIHAIGVLLGQQPDSLVPSLSTPSAIPTPPRTIPLGLPSDLLRRRPDIRRVERELAAATASIGVAEANLYPQFSLNGDLGVGAISASDLFNWSSRYVSFGPSARWLLFDAGRVLADVDSRRAVRQELLDEYQQTILSATREVEDSIVAVNRSQDTCTWNRQTMQADQEAVRIASELYGNGLTGFLNVLDTERSLFAAKDAVASNDGEIAVDVIALYKSLGGGWETRGRGSN
jgi:outer membrane protein, multidrug efflux system